METLLTVRDLTMKYGDRLIMEGLEFTVRKGDVFVIMGGSGCGKSTLLRHLIGLQHPASGSVKYGEVDLWEAPPERREALMRRFGILYQSGALWTSMTLAENVALPLEEYSGRSPAEIRDIVSLKLALVGLAGFEDHYPSEVSGGMRKRAGIARAMSLDPEVLFLDEPSAGLDPLTARRLDDLILELRASLGSTVVVVTHELASIFAIGTDSVFLDAESRRAIAGGDPRKLRAEARDPKVREFLTRGGTADEGREGGRGRG
jgi:phospholipid/cholesterol/gamma-HCH transport system ATP-binding protein